MRIWHRSGKLPELDIDDDFRSDGGCDVLAFRSALRFKRSPYSRPSGLRPSTIPLTIVCGPPAGGKTTLVRDRAGPEDLVLDLDEIGARVSKMDTPFEHDWDRTYLIPALKERNRYLRELGRGSAPWPAAWFIVGAPSRKERLWWQDRLRPMDFVMLVPSPEICHQRVKAAGGTRRERRHGAVDDWFVRHDEWKANDSSLRLA